MQSIFINIFLICKFSIIVIIISLIYILLKLSIKRQYYNKFIPTLHIRFIDLFGHLNIFPYSYMRNNWNGFSSTTYIWQVVKGHFHIFKEELLFISWVSYLPFIALNSPEAMQEVLSGSKAIEKNWIYDWLHCWLGTGLLTSGGKKWKTRRKLLTPAFHFDILKTFLPVINEKSRQLVKVFEKETTKDFIDVTHPLSLCSLDIICETTLGVSVNAQENGNSSYVRAVEKVSRAVTTRIYHPLCWLDFTYFLTFGRRVRKNIKLLHDFTTSVIHEKKKHLSTNTENAESHTSKQKALMDILLKHHIETKELTEEDIREEVDTFIFEGHGTTSLALSWAVYMIGLYRDIQENLHKELYDIFGDDCESPVTKEELKDMKYLECVIKETLRLFPPVSVFGRRRSKIKKICGYKIPENAALFICPYMLHRNENLFPNPEKFDPDRFTLENSKGRHPYAYIPFSAGPRNCIGQKFAMMELKIILSSILRNYTIESLCPRDKVLPCFDLILRPTNGIKIKFRRRHFD